MKIATDTLALISLQLSAQLESALTEFELLISDEVKVELAEISRFKGENAKAANELIKLIKSGQIKEKKVNDQKFALSLVNSNVDFGEATVFQLAIEEEIKVVLIDDLNALYALSSLANAKNIKLIISAAAIVKLMQLEKLTKEQAKKALNLMITNQNWQKSTMEYLIQKLLK